jgi:AcrR family transcriptional regulator
MARRYTLLAKVSGILTSSSIDQAKRGPRPGSLSERQRKQIVASTGAIIKALGTLLKERDYTEISTDDIISTAEVSRGTFYRHFKSKYDVAVALYERAFAKALDHYALLGDVATGGTSAMEWIRGAIDHYRAEGKASLLIYQLGATDRAFHDRLRTDRHTLINRLGDAVPAFSKARGRAADAIRHHARADILLIFLDRMCAEIAIYETVPDDLAHLEIMAEHLYAFLHRMDS